MYTVQQYIEDAVTRPDSFAVWNDKPLFDTWGISHASVSRDSSILAQSNWDIIQAALSTIDPNQEYWEVLSCNHWVCGWIDHIIFDCQYAPIVNALYQLYVEEMEYPVLGEEDYSNRQYEAISDYWEELSLQEKIEYSQESGCSIFAVRRGIPEKVWDRLYDDESFQ